MKVTEKFFKRNEKRTKFFPILSKFLVNLI